MPCAGHPALQQNPRHVQPLHDHDDVHGAGTGVELPSKASDLASNGKDVVVDAAQLKLHLTASAPSEQRAAQAPTPAPVSDATRAPHPEDRASPGSPHAERHGRSSSPGAGARNGFENVPLQPGDDAEGRPAHMGHGNDSELAREPRASGTEDREDAQLLQGQESSAEGEGQSGDKPWYKDKSVLVAVLGASLVALSWNFLDELTPIFASAPPKQVSAPCPARSLGVHAAWTVGMPSSTRPPSGFCALSLACCSRGNTHTLGQHHSIIPLLAQAQMSAFRATHMQSLLLSLSHGMRTVRRVLLRSRWNSPQLTWASHVHCRGAWACPWSNSRTQSYLEASC